MEDEVDNQLSAYLLDVAEFHTESEQMEKVQQYLVEKQWLIRMPNHAGKLPFHIALEGRNIFLDVVLFLLEQWPEAAQIYMKCKNQLPITWVLRNWDQHWKSEMEESKLVVDLVSELCLEYPDGLTEFYDDNNYPLDLAVNVSSCWHEDIAARMTEVALNPTTDNKLRQRLVVAFELKQRIRTADQEAIFKYSLQQLEQMTTEQQKNWLKTIKEQLSEAIKRNKVLEGNQRLMTDYYMRREEG